MENPFKNVDMKRHIEPEPEARRGRREVLIYDCETVPDERIYPPPEKEILPLADPLPDREDIDLDDLMQGSVSEIKKELAEGFSDRQLRQLLDIENARKSPRKGVVSSIDSHLNADASKAEAVREQNEKAFADWRKEGSVNPLKARIVALGWAFAAGEVEAMVATTYDEERELLTKFWELRMQCVKRCGYNILRFDDRLVTHRSALLGVEVPKPLDRKSWGREAVDLFHVFCDGRFEKGADGSGRTAKEVCRLMGIEPLVDTTGEQVYDLWEKGNMEAIKEYVISDVHVEREMYLFAKKGYLV